MADEVDLATEIGARALEHAVRAATAATIPLGTPGDCDGCGEWSRRLVGGRCARCRDGRRR